MSKSVKHEKSTPKPTTKRCDACAGKGVNLDISATDVCQACNGDGTVKA